MEKENNTKTQKKKMKKKEENIGTLSMKQNMQKTVQKHFRKQKCKKKISRQGTPSSAGVESQRLLYTQLYV